MSGLLGFYHLLVRLVQQRVYRVRRSAAGPSSVPPGPRFASAPACPWGPGPRRRSAPSCGFRFAPPAGAPHLYFSPPCAPPALFIVRPPLRSGLVDKVEQRPPGPSPSFLGLLRAGAVGAAASGRSLQFARRFALGWCLVVCPCPAGGAYQLNAIRLLITTKKYRSFRSPFPPTHSSLPGKGLPSLPFLGRRYTLFKSSTFWCK